MSAIRHRLAQVGWYLRRHDEPAVPPDAAALMTPAIRAQWDLLPAADRAHLLRVYSTLAEEGASRALLTAGLLHDIGKACHHCRRIGVLTRATHVVLRRVAPGAYRTWAAQEDVPAQLRPLRRLATHPERAASALEQEHYSADVIDLVRHHEDATPRSTDLQRLRAADASA